MPNSDLTIRNCTFAYKCAADWDLLQTTNDDSIRFCNECQREVHYCEDDDELAHCVKLNRCIAIYKEDSAEKGNPKMLLGDVTYPNK